MSILLVFKLLSSLVSLATGEVPKEILFESLESKTNENKVVFNKIKFEEKGNIDIWKMQQSHGGIHSDSWDNIMIKVDTSKKPYKVSYHQLKNGIEVDYKAACLRCHSGGPRLIRANEESKKAKLSLSDQLKILEWNLKIKSYGKVVLKENNPFPRKVSLHVNIKASQSKLKLSACTDCHRKGGVRNELSLENKGSITFLVGKGEMPPWPYKLTKNEKLRLKEFIYGF